jgi:hypothetical protein
MQVMRFARITYTGNYDRVLAQFTPEEFVVRGHLGFVYIEMPEEKNNDHKYRIVLSKQQAIQLITEMYEYLEDDLAQVK